MSTRILHIQKCAGVGGAEKHLSLLLPELVKAGYEVHYLIAEPPNAVKLNDSFISSLLDKGVHCHRVRLKSDLSPIGLGILFKIIRNLKPDILHTHLIQGDLYGALYKTLFPKMILVSTRHGYDEVYQAKFDLSPDRVHDYKNIYYWLSRFAAHKSSGLIGISHGISRLLSAILRDSSKVKTIWYGYESRKVIPISEKPSYLYYIGRLIPFKYPGDLISAYVLYRQMGGCLPLKIAGSGEDEAGMKIQLRASAYEADVEFLGRIPNPEAYLFEAACLCVSSHSEGFGLVALEAMNAGLPILAYDVPALNEIVVSGETGILCPKGDVIAFAKGMLAFEKDAGMRTTLGAAGKRRLEEIFTISEMVSKTSNLYDSLVGN
jgi:glycosyltransferase involved in cell wall biosynthesis